MRHIMYGVLFICMFFLFLPSCKKKPTWPEPVMISATVNYTVLDSATSTPVSQATILVYWYSYPDVYSEVTLTTDSQGKASTVTSGLSTSGKGSFHTIVSKDGYETKTLEPLVHEDGAVIDIEVNLLKVAR